MSAHSAFYHYAQALASGEAELADPGNAGVFEIGDRPYVYCDLTPAGGGETRVLPTNDDAIAPGTEIFLRNKSDTHSISITNGAVSVTLAANTARLCTKTNYVGDLPRHWMLSAAYEGGS